MSHFAADEFKELVRSRTDIVNLISESVTLNSQRGGREFVGLCPFHDDHNPSMRVYPDRQSYKCWSCGEGGDCFSFVMKREGIGFRETLEMLARRANVELPKAYRAAADTPGQNKNRLYEIVAWAENEFHECLLKSPTAERARRYLQERGISGNSIARFRLGFHPDDWQWLLERARGRFAPSELATVKLVGEREGNNGYFDYFVNRVMFPIRDAQKRPVAFGGRILPGSPDKGMAKYFNSVDNVLFHKSRLLYALDHARESISKSGTVVVTEGYTDCIMAHQYGLTNFVATLGTALNESHVINLKRLARRVVLVYDGDEAGQRATERALPKLLAHEIDLRIATLHDNLDPADFLIQRGPEELISILDRAGEAWEQKFRILMQRHGLGSIDARHRVLTEMLETLSQVPAQAGLGLTANWQMRENVIVGQLSQRLKVSEANIRERLGDLRTAHQQKAGTSSAVHLSSAAPDPSPGEFHYSTSEEFGSGDSGRNPEEFAGQSGGLSRHDAETQQPQRAPSTGQTGPLFPRKPGRDDLAARDLLAILFTMPEKAEAIRGEITLDEVENPHLRELLGVCFQMHDQGIHPAYDRVTARLEDVGLKNLAVEIDLYAREVAVSAVLVEHTLGYFRRRRNVAGAPGLVGPHAPQSAESLDQESRERLRQATELHRKRVSRTI